MEEVLNSNSSFESGTTVFNFGMSKDLLPPVRPVHLFGRDGMPKKFATRDEAIDEINGILASCLDVNKTLTPEIMALAIRYKPELDGLIMYREKSTPDVFRLIIRTVSASIVDLNGYRQFNIGSPYQLEETTGVLGRSPSFNSFFKGRAELTVMKIARVIDALNCSPLNVQNMPLKYRDAVIEVRRTRAKSSISETNIYLLILNHAKRISRDSPSQGIILS